MDAAPFPLVSDRAASRMCEERLAVTGFLVLTRLQSRNQLLIGATGTQCTAAKHPTTSLRAELVCMGDRTIILDLPSTTIRLEPFPAVACWACAEHALHVL